MKVSIKEFAEKMGVSKTTVRNWTRKGKLVCERTDGGHRRFDISSFAKKNNERYCICYARVSTHGQKTDLQRQKEVLEMYCVAKGYQYKTITDIGSGINYKKQGLLTLLDLIEKNEINRVVLTHKDRLLRFGAEIIHKMCEYHDVVIEFIDKDEEKPDYNKELVDDVLSIITVFSARLYGKRNNKKEKIIKENTVLFNGKEG